MNTPIRTVLGRNVVAMVTPMLPDGELDLVSTQALVERLVGHCDGLVVCGTTGEAPTLSDDEVASVVRTAARAAGGRAPVIAGVGTNDTRHAVRLAEAARDAGADALLVLAPYYSRPTQRGIVAHCEAVLGAVDLPIMLYDNPGRTGVEIAPQSVAELARHRNVVAIKDSRGDLDHAMTLSAETGVSTYCGIDDLNLPFLAIGAAGLVSVVANVRPETTARMIDAVDAGDLVTARRIALELRPLVRRLAHTSQGAIVAKAALALTGTISHSTVRLPLVEDGAEDVARLADLVAVGPTSAPAGSS